MRKPLFYTMITLGVFALLAVAGSVLMSVPVLRTKMQSISSVGPLPQDSGYYLGYYNGSMDHLSVFHNLNQAAEKLTSADVLFLGNSRMLYAIDRSELQKFEQRSKLHCYVMAFPCGELCSFPYQIIQKYDLHPKLVVVNTDPFFAEGLSNMARRTIKATSWEAWKDNFELNCAFGAHRLAHQWLPHLFEPEVNWLYFRHKDDGTIFLSSCKGRQVPVDELALPWGISPDNERTFSSFCSLMNMRGTAVVLTTVPPAVSQPMIDLARKTSTPFIMTEEKNLVTIDGGHLDHASAIRYSAALFNKLDNVVRSDSRLASRSVPATKMQ